MRTDLLNNALLECYCELYSNSEPKADFNSLMENATVNELGQKVINFMEYEIDNNTMDVIIDNIINKYKIKGYQAKQFRTTVYLGCSPKTKINE